ncbi:inositol monophosphatase family protein [Actinocorallia lasiicapitis]
MGSLVGDVEVAVRAAKAGAEVVAAGLGEPLERVDKGGGDFATATDLAAERAILAVLREARPGDAVLGEESGRTGGESARTWLVDPLCGTLNYAVRNLLVGVNVALRDGAETVAAAVADPFSGEVFWTDGTAVHVRAGETDETISPSAASRLVDLNLDPPFPSAPRLRVARLLTDPRFGAEFRPRVVSTTLALAWVAAGRRAAYVTDGHPLDSVHFAAGIALCQAAGCTVTDLDGGPLTPDAPGLVAAADPATHRALLELLAGQVTGSSR